MISISLRNSVFLSFGMPYLCIFFLLSVYSSNTQSWRVQMTSIDSISEKIKRSRRYVFERKDFNGIASYDQVGRALKQLVKNTQLMKLGYGLYTKARLNSLTGKPMPTHPGGTDALMREILKMKGVDFVMDSLSLQSLSGGNTQIPSSVHYSWDPKQFNRKLLVGDRALNLPH